VRNKRPFGRLLKPGFYSGFLSKYAFLVARFMQ